MAESRPPGPALRYDPAAMPRAKRPKLLMMSTLPPSTGGIPTWTVGLRNSELAEHFELRIVDSAPTNFEAVSGESRFRGDRAVDAIRTLSRWIYQLVTFRPDVVHVNTPYYWAFLRDGLAIWLASLAGAKTALHPRGGDFPDFVEGAPRWLRFFIDATVRRATRCIALTRPNEALFREITDEDRIRYVPNFIKLQDLGEIPDRSQRREGRVKILFVGWMLEAKGVRELLAAARALPQADFTLIGAEDPDFVAEITPELEALAGHVKRLPPRPRADVLELYHEADVFVLPTWREGFPNVVLEAMGAGLPVVSTPVGAIPDAVREGEDGFLVPVEDAAALTEALRRLVEDRDLRLRMGASGRARAVEVFSMEAVIEQLEAVYGEMMESA